jgi:hypothetical protein
MKQVTMTTVHLPAAVDDEAQVQTLVIGAEVSTQRKQQSVKEGIAQMLIESMSRTDIRAQRLRNIRGGVEVGTEKGRGVETKEASLLVQTNAGGGIITRRNTGIGATESTEGAGVEVVTALGGKRNGTSVTGKGAKTVIGRTDPERGIVPGTGTAIAETVEGMTSHTDIGALTGTMLKTGKRNGMMRTLERMRIKTRMHQRSLPSGRKEQWAMLSKRPCVGISSAKLLEP